MLIPVLALLIEAVRRCADRRTGGEDLAEGPHVGAVATHSDGEVGDDADTHSRRQCGVLGPGELFVADPLQPRVELDASGQPSALGLDEDRITEFVGPRRTVPPVFLDQRAPGGEITQAGALTTTELPVRCGTRRSQRNRVQQLQRGQLCTEGLVALDLLRREVVGDETPGEFVDTFAVGLGRSTYSAMSVIAM